MERRGWSSQEPRPGLTACVPSQQALGGLRRPLDPQVVFLAPRAGWLSERRLVDVTGSVSGPRVHTSVLLHLKGSGPELLYSLIMG